MALNFKELIVDESRFTHRFFRRFVDLFWLGILTTICSIPVITIGASFSSLFYCCRKISKNEDYKLTNMFFKQMKSNFKNGAILTIVMLIALEIVYTGYVLLASPSVIFGENVILLPDFARIVIIILCAYILLIIVHFWPLQATFENTAFNIVKNASIVAIMNFPSSILLVLLYGIPIAICYFWPFMLPFLVMFGFSGPYRMSIGIYRKIFKRMGVEETITPDVSDDDWNVDIEEIKEEVNEEINDGQNN